MKSNEIRDRFLGYFEARDHRIVPSSPLVPANDPTLLFTNAGMVPFKELFLGNEQRDYKRAATSQRCVRAGGKHNDLENVGYTARHHTFFEMLGNFSFGDYFKREAIGYAWEFLTRELGLAPGQLWITVYHEDDEAASIWLDEIGVDPERFSRLDEKDNFWAMGDTGPCGPCSEIFFDHGEDVPGGPPGTPEEDGDRYIEIWNLVFMQYDRQKDGRLEPLPKPSVDTGMGLERLAAVLQGVHSNYQIDLFQNLLAAAGRILGESDTANTSLCVIADHIRSCAFLIVDGVVPSNEGRGYVLRRIIRRAVRHGYQLGVDDLFFHRLVPALVEEMGDAYPELKRKQSHVEEVLHSEEQQFARTLEHGMSILEQAIKDLDGDVLPGTTVFRLYDTYGFPVDLTADVAREHGLGVDMEGFEAAMEEQREQARRASQFNAVENLPIDVEQGTKFIGYDHLSAEGRVLAIHRESGDPVDELDSGDDGVLILDCSPFYAESGGQVGDRGVLEGRDGEALFEVFDTQQQGEHVLHRGQLRRGRLSAGEKVVARVARQDRHATMLNHSATHLLHEALRQVLGDQVTQKGSLVAADRLRFDFSHNAPLTRDEVREIEAMVNDQILRNEPVSKEVMSMDEAMDRGALAMFGEKYGERVRVVTMGDFSTELCGGTHVERTGDIGLFKLVSESGVAAGVRRVEAVTGRGALAYIEREEAVLREVCEALRASPEEAAERAGQLVDSNRRLERELEQAKARLASAAGTDIADTAESLGEVKLLTRSLEGFNSKTLRETVDQLKNKLGSAVIVLANVEGDKVSLVAGVTRDLTDRIEAGELVNMVAEQLGGKGGGRPDMAMAGGKDSSAVPQALESVRGWVQQRL